jgi:tripartite-type tricarboxylate transporter receptor subunit TctC
VIDPYTFFGIVGPPGMPADVVARLNRAVQDAVASPDVVAAFAKLYTVPVSGSAQDFRAYVERQLAKWKPYAGKFQLAPN